MAAMFTVLLTSVLASVSLVATNDVNVYTIYQEPFIMKATDDDPESRFGLKGILVDLMSSIVDQLGIRDSAIKVEVLKIYGQKEKNGSWTGLIANMIGNNRTEVAVADVTVNSERLDAVQYSLPYLTTGLSALVKNLPFPLTLNNLPKLVELAQKDKVDIGCQKAVATERFFRDTEVPIYKELYKQMKKQDSNFVTSPEDGVNRVRKAPTDKPYVYFEEKAYLDYYAGKAPCDLSLPTCETLNTVHYALVFSKTKNQADINAYNKQISDFLASGKMNISIKKWFKNECQGNSTAS